MKHISRLFLAFIAISFSGGLLAQGTPGEGFAVVETIRQADYPGSIPDSNGVGGDDVLAGYDLDQDGKGEFIVITDNLAATSGGPAIIVFEASADDTYDPVWWYQVREHDNDASFPALTVGDMDSDGNLEILAGIPWGGPEPANPDRFLVFEADPTLDNGLPTEPTASWNLEADLGSNTRPTALDVYDVDGDGVQEVMMTLRQWNGDGNRLMIFSLLGDFQGVFTAFSREFFDETNLRETDGNIYNVNAHDVNRDGDPEISVVEWEGSGIIAVFYQSTGPDQYEMVNKVTTFPADAGALGSFLPWDIDGDGIEEFMMAGSDGSVYVVPVANGDVTQITAADFVSIITYPEQVRGATIGDFDGDDLVDFMIAGSTNEKIFRVEYTGSGDITDAASYDTTTIYDDPDAGRFYYIAFPQDRSAIRDGQTLVDMDGDERRELVFTDQQTGSAEDPVYVTVLEADHVVSVEIPNLAELPSEFDLHQNFPNPFNPETRIRYDIPRAGHVKITVYNMLGEEVRTLVDESKVLGSHEVTWDGRDNKGQKVPSGVYVYSLVSGGIKMSKQMTLVK